MTDYTKTTDFTSKDSLPSGDSGKIIRGAEFGTEFDNIETAVNSKSNIDNPSFTGNITVTGTVDGRDIAADGTKLDTVETSADVTDTANVTAAGAVMDSELTDITAVKALNQGVATTDSPTFAAVTSTGNVTVDGTVDGRDVATDGTKLDTVETNADVTDTTNVTAAGALMDSEVTNLDQVKAFDSADYATAAQGATADAALPKTGGAMTGAITTNSTFDGRDVATDGTKLDGIEALADVTDTTNVTAAGALMDSELTNLTAVKSLDQGVATTDSPTFAGLTTTADMSFGDNDKAIFGAGSDLQIYHDGSNSYISEVGTGELVIQARDAVTIEDGTSGDNYVYMQRGNKVSLFYAGAEKLATTSTGIQVGTFSGNSVAQISAGTTGVSSLYLGDGSSGAASYAGFVEYNHTDDYLRLGAGSSERVRVDSTGIDVTGTITADGLTVSNLDGSIVKLESTGTGLGAGAVIGDLQFYGNDASTPGAGIKASITATTVAALGDDSQLMFSTSNGTTNNVNRMLLANNGDISFYEDTGTTAKLFWDASAESLGIGTSSPSGNLEIATSASDTGVDFVLDGNKTSNGGIGSIIFNNNGDSVGMIRSNRASANDAADMLFYTQATGGANTERMRIDSNGDMIMKGGRIKVRESDDGNDAVVITRDADEGYVNLYSSGTQTIEIRSNGNSYFNGGNVGIGTISPSVALAVQASSGASRINVGTGSVAGDHGLNVVSGGASNDYGIFFNGSMALGSKTNTGTQLKIGSNGTETTFQTLTFHTNATEAMRIDSSGNLLVGTTTVNGTGITLGAGDYGYFSRSGDAALFVNRSTSDGSLIELRKADVAVGSIGTLSSALTIGTGDTGVQFNADTNAIMPHNISTGANVDASIDIGYSSGGTNRRFKDLYLSGGVYLGGTGSANKLDDYETGTWTPTLVGSTTGGSHTYGYQNGKYTKIGNTVTASFAMYVSTKDASMAGNVTVSGLPVSASMGTNTFANLVIGWAANITYGDMLGGYINSGTSISLRLNDSAAASGFLNSSAIGSGSVYLFGTITYQTA